MEVPPNDLFSLFSCTKHEISKICSDSGDAAINLKSSFRVAFWRISAFSYGNSDYTSCAEELWKITERIPRVSLKQCRVLNSKIGSRQSLYAFAMPGVWYI